ncbi:hypothetical protein, conserved [Angomonas deanei]|uniref:Uncharacterized protein n=1 Tax=Angomonas deanei TaxID=59799 RepID=A0A7G2C4W5_9TRYP|nr:hypothetical protein, conserved [Angomonas deanei]
MPWWVYLSIVLGCLGVIAVLVFFIVQLCKKDDEKRGTIRKRGGRGVNPLASPDKTLKSDYVPRVGSILPTTEEDDVVLIREAPPQDEVVAEPSGVSQKSRRATRNSTFLIFDLDTENQQNSVDAISPPVTESSASPRRTRRPVSFQVNDGDDMDF